MFAFHSSSQEPLGVSHVPDRRHGGAGPVLAVLAADPRVRVPLAARRSALHAGVQSHVLRAVHPRQHLPGEEQQPELNGHVTPASWRPCWRGIVGMVAFRLVWRARHHLVFQPYFQHGCREAGE